LNLLSCTLAAFNWIIYALEDETVILD